MLQSARLARNRRRSAQNQPRQAPFGRLLALLVLALFSAGLTLPGLHHLFVEHAVCAEHGELIHAEPAGAAKKPARSAPVELRTAASEQHGHEHCSVSAVGGAPCLVSHEPDAVRLSFEAPRADAPVGTFAAYSSVALLAFAPKLAPPV